jgi:hypothetical protein
MHDAIKARLDRLAVERQRMRATVDDHQSLRCPRERLNQLVVGAIAEALQTHALQLLV